MHLVLLGQFLARELFLDRLQGYRRLELVVELLPHGGYSFIRGIPPYLIPEVVQPLGLSIFHAVDMTVFCGRSLLERARALRVSIEPPVFRQVTKTLSQKVR
jgi:hypothetical protein